LWRLYVRGGAAVLFARRPWSGRDAVPFAWDLVAKRLHGWPELGRAVGEVMMQTSGTRPATTATDRHLLAFYVPATPVYNANFGRR